MTATNGDLLYTKALKKENSNSLRDLSRRTMHRNNESYNESYLFLFIFFLLRQCVCLILV